MNRIFYNHIDHSEALTTFINSQTESLQAESSNWIISKEGQKEFKVKCISRGQAFTETGHDPYFLVCSIVDKIKHKERRKYKSA
jgi:hypothetical protein